MRMRRLVALVVTHNRLEQLKVTVVRLLESPPNHLERLVICDNASDDGTAAWLAGLDDPRVDVVTRAENGGGAAGFEDGMRHAVARYDPDWLVLMDDDGRPDAAALARFHAMDVRDWDAVAAAVYYPDGAICDMNRPSKNPFWHKQVFLRSLVQFGGRDGFHLSPADYTGTDPLSIDITSFVGLFLSREAIAKAGYPDGGLFLYGDDGLYTLRLRKAGGRIAFAPAIRFEHACSTFHGPRFSPLWKVYYYHRNLLFLYAHAAGWAFWPLMVLVVPKWLSKARAHRGTRVIFLRLLAKAIWDGLLQRKNVRHQDILAKSMKKQSLLSEYSGYPDGTDPEVSAPKPHTPTRQSAETGAQYIAGRRSGKTPSGSAP